MHSKFNDDHWMQQALALAQRAESEGEVPVGAVLIWNDELIAEAWNQPIAHHDPTAHAEILAMRKAGQALKNYRLLDTTLYVTLEPCAMCAAAIVHARVKRLVFGACDPKAGAVESVMQLFDNPKLNHHVDAHGHVLADECSALLKRFFQNRR